MTWEALLVRILLSAALGGLIGLERELRDRAAGFRTHILVSVGSAAFTLSSVYGFQDFMTTADESVVRLDPARIAAQIVSGIGFLGAGAIIRHGVSVRGLTTAASLWAVAAVGLATGLGLYALATVTTLTVVVSLSVLRFFEGRFLLPRAPDRALLFVTFREKGFGQLGHLVELLEKERVRVLKLSVEPEDAEQDSVRVLVSLPPDLTVPRLLAEVGTIADVTQAVSE